MSKQPPNQFNIDECVFEVNRLKVKDSLKGLRLVGKVLFPALAEASSAPKGQIGDAIQKAVEGLDCLPELLDLFAPYTKFSNDKRPTLTSLTPFIEDVFEGHPDWVVQYLVEAAKGEYGAFLDGNGPLAKLWKTSTETAISDSPSA